MPLKPRLVLATLLTASLFGVYLTWAGSAVPIVVPLASWLALVSFGTLLTAGLLWRLYADATEVQPDRVAHRWTSLLYSASGAAVAAVCVRLLQAGVVVNLPQSPTVSLAVGVVMLGVLAAGVRRIDSTRPSRGVVVLGSAGAVGGLAGLAWINVSMSGGTFEETVVRAIHLVAAGAWIGGAIWHNIVVVAVRAAPDGAGVKPVLRGFQRIVPLLVIAVLGTGMHQATTWLGTSPSTYLTTSVGRVVTLKLVAVLVLATVVARSLLKQRSISTSAAENTS
jgi:putative copper resistance protein D